MTFTLLFNVSSLNEVFFFIISFVFDIEVLVLAIIIIASLEIINVVLEGSVSNSCRYQYRDLHTQARTHMHTITHAQTNAHTHRSTIPL